MIVAVSGVVILVGGFGGGYMVGRSHPAHHYVYRAGDIMYDEATGHFCTGVKPAPPPHVSGDQKTDIFDLLAQENNRPKYPYCGEE